MALTAKDFLTHPEVVDAQKYWDSMTSAVGGTPGKRSWLPWRSSTPPTAGKTASDLFKDLQSQFLVAGDKVDSVLPINQLDGNHALMDIGLKNQASGLPFNESSVRDAYARQTTLIAEQEKLLEQARQAVSQTMHEPVIAVNDAAEKLLGDLEKVRAGSVAVSTTGAGAGAVTTVTGIDAAHKDLFHINGSNLEFKVANVADKTAPQSIKIGTIGASGAVTMDAAGLQKARQELGKVRVELTRAPQALADQARKEIALIEEKLGQYKSQAGETGSKLLGIAEQATPAVVGAGAKVASAVVKNAAGDIISEEAAKLGVIGEEAMKAKTGVGGFFSKIGANMKANLNTSGALKLENGVVTAEKAGLMNQGIKIASTGAGVFLVGAGLKDLGQVVGVLSPDVDEQGKEVPADSGKLIKSIAEVGGGAALAYFSLLKGGKAVGLVK